jgi:hypothetical protein
MLGSIRMLSVVDIESTVMPRKEDVSGLHLLAFAGEAASIGCCGGPAVVALHIIGRAHRTGLHNRDPEPTLGEIQGHPASCDSGSDDDDIEAAHRPTAPGNPAR